MTGEEAFKLAMQACKETWNEKTCAEIIKALEQEPTDDATLRDIFCMGCEYKEQEPCEDAISRDAVLEKAVYTETEEGWCGYTVDVDYIKSLPPVKQKSETVTEFADRCRECGAKYGKLLKQDSKIGHWIKYGVPRCGEQHYKCTSCGYYINFGQWGELYSKEFKYCPNCGARMQAESEET